MEYESDVDAMIGGARDGAKIGKIAAQAIAWIFFVVSRPAVLVTQVFLRKDLGERYFTAVQAVLGMLVILIACMATVAMVTPREPVFQDSYNNYYGTAPRTEAPSEVPEVFAYIVGISWLIAFAVMAAKHFFVTLPLRQTDGVLWHSRSDGSPRMSFPYEMLLLLGLTIFAWWTHLYGFGFLLALSLMVTLLSEAHSRSQLYNRVLDVIDGQIESECLGNAIEQRLSPAQSHGLKAALPAHVSGEYRRKVAQYFKQHPPAVPPSTVSASPRVSTPPAMQGAN